MRDPAVRPGPGRGAFTLVELMVVIGIMAILIGITVPVFTSIGQGQGLRSAVAELRATLSLARQWAITHRENTYVIFPTDNTALYSGHQEDAFKAMKAYSVYTKSDGIIREWTFLPAGVVFEDKKESAKNVFAAKAFEEDVKWPSTNSASTLPCLVFRPDGSMRPTGGEWIHAEVFLTQGSVMVSTNGSLKIDYKPENDGILYSIQTYPATGLVRVNEYTGS